MRECVAPVTVFSEPVSVSMSGCNAVPAVIGLFTLDYMVDNDMKQEDKAWRVWLLIHPRAP